MMSRQAESEVYFKKAVTWSTVSSACNLNYISQYFYINNERCSLSIKIALYDYDCEYEVKVNLIFPDKYTNYGDSKFILILYFGDSKQGHTFHLTSLDNVRFENYHKSVIYDTALSNSTIQITAEFFYKTYKNFEVSSSFTHNMKHMLSSETHSDFKIKAGDTIFNVHKAIIAARCRVLKKMIENDMKEKQSGQLELQADPVLVQLVLEFIYTDKTRVALFPTELFRLAHFLEIHELEVDCAKYLIHNINVKNIISILELTSYSDYDLKELHNAAMKFVESNERALLEDQEFEGFLCTNIKIETITYILKFAYKNQVTSSFEKCLEFIRINYQEVLKDLEFTMFIKNQSDLFITIFQNCLDFFNKPKSDDQKVDVQKVNDQKVDDQKVDEQKVDDQKVNEQKVDEQKVDDQKVNDQKVDDQTVVTTE